MTTRDPSPSRFLAAGHTYLPGMYQDDYFPDALVDKVKAQLEGLVAYLEGGKRTQAEVQARCDEMTRAINGLQDDFEEAESELETGAREEIVETVTNIFDTYGVDLDSDDALREREW